MDGVMRLSAGQLAALVEGLDWTRVHVPRVVRPAGISLWAARCTIGSQRGSFFDNRGVRFR
jgi:transposase